MTSAITFCSSSSALKAADISWAPADFPQVAEPTNITGITPEINESYSSTDSLNNSLKFIYYYLLMILYF